MAYPTLDVSREGPFVSVALNRPEVRNALNGQVIADLHDWAHEVRTMDGVRVVVVSGHGASFCAGADAAWMAQAVHQSDEENRQEAERVGAMLTALDTLPIPVIGRVHGAALGGGADRKSTRLNSSH